MEKIQSLSLSVPNDGSSQLVSSYREFSSPDPRHSPKDATSHWHSRCFGNTEPSEVFMSGAVLVWLETDMAKIFDLEPGKHEPAELRRHLVVQCSGDGRETALEKGRFFERIARNLHGAGHILLAGPGRRKSDFALYLKDHDRDLAGALAGMEEVARLNDKELLEFSLAFFSDFPSFRGKPVSA
jgi:hypothetical protein